MVKGQHITNMYILIICLNFVLNGGRRWRDQERGEGVGGCGRDRERGRFCASFVYQEPTVCAMEHIH